MSIDVVCPECSSHFQTDDSAVGKLGKCPACFALVTTSPGTGSPAKPSLQEILNQAPAAPQAQTQTAVRTSTAVAEEEPPYQTPCPANPAAVGVEQVSRTYQGEKRGFFSPPDKSRSQAINQMVQANEEDDLDDGGFFGPEKKGISRGMLGGIIMMLIAAVWFFVGLAADVVFFYPPILFFIGVFAFAKGLATGNFFGRR